MCKLHNRGILSEYVPIGIILLKTISVILTNTRCFLLLMFGNKDMIKVFDSHLEIKTVPGVSMEIIKFYQIKQIVVTKNNLDLA